jgi:hypothetical protein
LYTKNRDFLKKNRVLPLAAFSANSHSGGNKLFRQPAPREKRSSGSSRFAIRSPRSAPGSPSSRRPPSLLGSGGGGGPREPSFPSTSAWRASRAPETSHCSPYTTTAAASHSSLSSSSSTAAASRAVERERVRERYQTWSLAGAGARGIWLGVLPNRPSNTNRGAPSRLP